jgi:hypothetical protein
VYRDLVAKLAARAPASPPAPKPVLRVRCVRHGWRAGLGNPPKGTRRIDFLLDGHRVRRDRTAPFRATLHAAQRRRAHTITASGRGVRLKQRVHACSHTATHVSTRG